MPRNDENFGIGTLETGLAEINSRRLWADIVGDALRIVGKLQRHAGVEGCNGLVVDMPATAELTRSGHAPVANELIGRAVVMRADCIPPI